MNRKERILQRIETSKMFPVVPEGLVRMFALLNSPVSLAIDELTEEIEKNPKMAELLLANINAAYVRFNTNFRGVREAVIYLGVAAVRNLLVFLIACRLFPPYVEDAKRRFSMRTYWSHVLATSMAADMLAGRLGVGVEDRFKLFTYGLLHDIGVLVLDACLPDHMERIFEKLENNVHSLIAEKTILAGLTHSDIGAWVCEKWNFGRDIVGIVRYHHAPSLSGENRRELEVFYVADVIGTKYYAKLLELPTHHYMVNPKIMTSLGLDDDKIREIEKAIVPEVENLKGRFVIWEAQS